MTEESCVNLLQQENSSLASENNELKTHQRKLEEEIKLQCGKVLSRGHVYVSMYT